MAHSFSIAVLK
jgi:endoglucanase